MGPSNYRFRPIVRLAMVALLLGAMASATQAVIVDLALYGMGESGTLGTNNRPQDSAGGYNFSNGSGATVVPGAPGGGSTDALYFSGGSGVGYYNVGTDFIPNNNVAVEMWVRTSNLAQTNDSIFQTTHTNGRLKFHAQGGNWAASLDNVSWIGATAGAGQPMTAGQWTHLAVVRDSGTSTFYINGVAQAGTTASAWSHAQNLHLGISPSNTARFNGEIDELRIFTFNPATDDPVAAFNIGAAAPGTITLNPSLDVDTRRYHDGSWHYLTPNFSPTAYKIGTSAKWAPQSDAPGRGYMKFDLSSIPGGASVSNAKLKLYRNAIGSQENWGTAELRLLSNDWDSSSSGADLYTSLGSTVVAADIAPGTSAGGTSPGWIVLDVTSVIQDWADGTSDNYGFAIYYTGESLGFTGDERSFAASGSANAPQLVIEYSQPSHIIPEPMTMLASGLSISGLGGYVRKRRRG